MQEYYIDIASFKVNKYQEELCGDNVEVVKTKDGMIIVLADGLGSGVKANILATLTSKIAVTMLKEGASIEETIDTITNTLPECQVRKLAYSTFTIIQIKRNGEVYMVEYDNPPVFYFRMGRSMPIHKEKRQVNGKVIYESNFKMRIEDSLTIVSDGAVHAGVGMTLNLGWQWEHINAYLEDLVKVEHKAEHISKHLLNVCENLYNDRPGDDTTIVTVKLEPIQYLDIFAGPPKQEDEDSFFIDNIRKAKGKVVLCGGTTANIAAREFHKEIKINLENYNEKVPPMGYMQGVDFVTEGLLTLNATKEILEEYARRKNNGDVPKPIEGEDGASKLARVMLEESTHIHFWIGQAINPAHQNPNFPKNFNMKNKIVEEITHKLRELGKSAEITYV